MRGQSPVASVLLCAAVNVQIWKRNSCRTQGLGMGRMWPKIFINPAKMSPCTKKTEFSENTAQSNCSLWKKNLDNHKQIQKQPDPSNLIPNGPGTPARYWSFGENSAQSYHGLVQLPGWKPRAAGGHYLETLLEKYINTEVSEVSRYCW